MTSKIELSSESNTARFLGAAFLLQAVASALSGLVLLRPLFVPGDIVASMTNLANNALRVRAGILVEMVTVVGLVILSVLFYLLLKRQNGKLALVALGFRLVEVALLAVSRVATFSLLRISQASVAAGHPADLQTLGNLLYEAQEYIYSLNMLFFTLGGTLFYYLLLKSGYIPRALALFGLVAAPLAFIGTLGELMSITVPLWLFLPNLPFELTIGVWLVIRGFRNGSETK